MVHILLHMHAYHGSLGTTNVMYSKTSISGPSVARTPPLVGFGLYRDGKYMGSLSRIYPASASVDLISGDFCKAFVYISPQKTDTVGARLYDTCPTTFIVCISRLPLEPQSLWRPAHAHMVPPHIVVHFYNCLQSTLDSWLN